MYSNRKLFVCSIGVIICVLIGMVSCARGPEKLPDTALLVIAPLSDSEYRSLWADTITPPSNPLAPALNDSMVTIRGSLHLDGLPWSANDELLYACIYSLTHTYYLMTPKIIGGEEVKIHFWQFDAPMLQPGYAGMTDTICVGDTIAVTGCPYSLFNRTATALDVRFVQKYSSPKKDEFK